MVYKLLIVAATVIWGSSFVLAKDLLDVISPDWLLFVRFGTAAVVLGLVCMVKGARAGAPGKRACGAAARTRGSVASRGLLTRVFTRDHLACGAVMGLFMFGAYCTQTFGLAGTTPGKNAFLTAVYSVLVPFVAWWIAHRRPTRFNLVAAGMSIAGVGLISLGSSDSLGMSAGDALSLVCAVFYSFHIVFTAKFSQGRDIYVLTTVQFAVVALLAGLAAALFEAPPDFSAFAGEDWFSLCYLAVCCTLVALSFQNIGQQHTSPASAALLLSLESPFGVAFSVAAGTESLTAQLLCGFALVFFAVLVSELLPQIVGKGRAVKKRE